MLLYYSNDAFCLSSSMDHYLCNKAAISIVFIFANEMYVCLEITENTILFTVYKYNSYLTSTVSNRENYINAINVSVSTKALSFYCQVMSNIPLL